MFTPSYSKDTYAVMGFPISHSLSPLLHRHFAEQTGQDIAYIAIETPPEQFLMKINEFKQRGGKGLNLTTPLKQLIIPALQIISARAAAAQAVNTLLWHAEKNQLEGDNTDGIGFLRDLFYHNIPLHQQVLAIIGAGGAVYGLLAALQELAHSAFAQKYPVLAKHFKTGPQKIYLLARQWSQVDALITAFPSLPLAPVATNSVPAVDMVIHATTAGLCGELPRINTEDSTSLNAQNKNLLLENLFNKNTIAYDLSYGQAAAPFLNFAQQHQVAAHNCYAGIGMLIEQAAEAFYRWRGIYPNTQALRHKDFNKP